jgi:hypothetical protein
MRHFVHLIFALLAPSIGLDAHAEVVDTANRPNDTPSVPSGAPQQNMPQNQWKVYPPNDGPYIRYGSPRVLTDQQLRNDYLKQGPSNTSASCKEPSMGVSCIDATVSSEPLSRSGKIACNVTGQVVRSYPPQQVGSAEVKEAALPQAKLQQFLLPASECKTVKVRETYHWRVERVCNNRSITKRHFSGGALANEPEVLTLVVLSASGPIELQSGRTVDFTCPEQRGAK